MNTNPQTLQSRLQQSTSSPKFLSLEKRTISLTEELKIDSDSSPEELSYRAEDYSDDDDEGDLAINSTKDNKHGNFDGKFDVETKKNLNFNSNECIPEYSAVEENKNVRNFNLITLPDGKTREIDMKVS